MKTKSVPQRLQNYLKFQGNFWYCTISTHRDFTGSNCSAAPRNLKSTLFLASLRRFLWPCASQCASGTRCQTWQTVTMTMPQPCFVCSSQQELCPSPGPPSIVLVLLITKSNSCWSMCHSVLPLLRPVFIGRLLLAGNVSASAATSWLTTVTLPLGLQACWRCLHRACLPQSRQEKLSRQCQTWIRNERRRRRQRRRLLLLCVGLPCDIPAATLSNSDLNFNCDLPTPPWDFGISTCDLLLLTSDLNFKFEMPVLQRYFQDVTWISTCTCPPQDFQVSTCDLNFV